MMSSTEISKARARDLCTFLLDLELDSLLMFMYLADGYIPEDSSTGIDDWVEVLNGLG